MMQLLTLFIVFALAPVVHAVEFKHVGDFLLQAQYKLTGPQMTPVPTRSEEHTSELQSQ